LVCPCRIPSSLLAIMLSAAFVNIGATSTPAFRAMHPASTSLGKVSGMPQLDSAAFGVTAGVASACSMAAVGVLSKQRRRSEISRRAVENSRKNDAKTAGYYAPTLVVNWQVEPKTPVPGSQKACETMVGADVEIGDGKPWDPMGFSKLYDRNFEFNMVMTYPHVQWLREAELKHGRVCMLAFVGVVAQKFFHVPGYPNASDWLTALDVCYTDKTATLGIIQISLFTMFVEGKYYSGDAWIGQMDREPGDLGFDPLKLTKTPGFNLKEFQLKEIKNGRLAMIGVASLAAAHTIPGSVPLLPDGF